MQTFTRYTMGLTALLLAGIVAGCQQDGASLVGPTAPALATSGLISQPPEGYKPKTRAPVNLGLAVNFVILSKSGISTTGTTSIVGNIGVSPIAATAITGFALVKDQLNTFSRSSLVTGKVYAADYSPPTPTMLTTAVSNMQTAYTDAAGRTLPDHTELGAGIIGGMTLKPGLYKWSSTVTIPTDVTLLGGPDDVWIFQIAGGITQAATAQVLLTGGALPKNIFWQAADAVALGATSHMEGIVLSAGAISLSAGATVNGRLMSQTAVTMDANTVSKPAL